MTLADAFSHLAKKSKKKIALIVDEAQHALNTEAGINAMFAIKAARDRLNQGSGSKLAIIFTGSHRDKLDAMSAYRKVLGPATINSQNIQAALEGLREKNLIWKSARGTYAIEDASIAHWFETKKK